MEFLETFLLTEDVNWRTSLARIVLSFIAGALIGLEREMNNQPAGLRTHILISIGSTLVMLISIFITQVYDSPGDPGRIAAQVVSGIGFLGAGAILKFGADIKGLTTAASIWTMAAVGMAIGAGMYGISLISVVVILFALTAMNLFEKKIFKDRSLRKIEVVVKKRFASLESIKTILHEHDVNVLSTGFDRNTNDATDKYIFIVAVTLELNVQKLADALEQQQGTVSVLVDILR